MRRAVMIYLIVVLFCVRSVYGEKHNPSYIVEEVDFEDALKTGGRITVMVGESLSLRFLTKNQKASKGAVRKLVVFYEGREVKTLPLSHYLRYTRIEAGPTKYWMIEEYTGGAHCCTRYHFFSRLGPNDPVKYIGVTAGSEGETPYYEGFFIFRNGEVYFEDVDIRFIYFHTSYARSQLFLPCFYRLTPSSLTTDNGKFKDRYGKELTDIEEEIEKRRAARRIIPHSMITSKEEFSDQLAQLLVKRTILYLYAREDEIAWQTLERDVRKYYKTTKVLEYLEKEIKKILSENPH